MISKTTISINTGDGNSKTTISINTEDGNVPNIKLELVVYYL